MAKTPSSGRGIGDWLSDRLIRGTIGLLLWLPYGTRVRLMGWLTAQVVAPLAGYRARVRANLAHVLPDLPEAEIRRLTRAVPDNVGRTLMELFSGQEFIDRVRDVPLTGPGAETLEHLLAAGRPVILVSGHFGNYDVGRAALTARGYRIGALYNPMKNVYFNRHYERALATMGEPIFPRGRRGYGQLLRFLRGGGTVGFLIDQFMAHGAPLSFFGKTAPTALSAAELALKYDVPLVPAYGVRQPDGLSFRIEIEAPIPPSDPEAMTQALNDSLEAMTRAHMEQWFWIHRRWKPHRQKLLAEARVARD